MNYVLGEFSISLELISRKPEELRNFPSGLRSLLNRITESPLIS